MSDLLITNVDVLTDNGTLKNHAVEIENGYITAILTGEEAKSAQSKETLDGKGQLAAPGLVNTHTHIAMGLFRNYADDLELMEWLETAIWPTEAKLNDDLVKWGTQLGIAEMLRSGTTTFSDMYFFMNTTADVVKETGIRAVLSRGLAGVSPTADQALVENADLFRTYHGLIRTTCAIYLSRCVYGKGYRFVSRTKLWHSYALIRNQRGSGKCYKSDW